MPGVPTWIDETVDLTPFAGRDVLVRFEYVTDQGFNLRGALVDDVAIPEIGFLDDAETDTGSDRQWLPALGQTRSRRPGERPACGVSIATAARPFGRSVRMLTAAWSSRSPGLGGDVEHAVLVVSGLAPRTLETARFRASLCEHRPFALARTLASASTSSR